MIFIPHEWISTRHKIAYLYVLQNPGQFLTMDCTRYLTLIVYHVLYPQVVWNKIIKLLSHYTALIAAPNLQFYDPRVWILSSLQVINSQCLIIYDPIIHILKYKHYLFQVYSIFVTHHLTFTHNFPSLITILNCQ